MGCWIGAMGCQISVMGCQIGAIGCQVGYHGLPDWFMSCQDGAMGCQVGYHGLSDRCQFPGWVSWIAMPWGCQIGAMGCQVSMGCQVGAMGCHTSPWVPHDPHSSTFGTLPACPPFLIMWFVYKIQTSQADQVGYSRCHNVRAVLAAVPAQLGFVRPSRSSTVSICTRFVRGLSSFLLSPLHITLLEFFIRKTNMHACLKIWDSCKIC